MRLLAAARQRQLEDVQQRLQAEEAAHTATREGAQAAARRAQLAEEALLEELRAVQVREHILTHSADPFHMGLNMLGTKSL